ncbi:L-rhamnose operon regulatory protein rhaS [Chlamydia abortus]|uniref:AraC family transcriptional regulator n=1 Tax=Paenibacillus sp. SAFN-117 TaxID=3436860 RepID=UPI000A27EF24|nr:L-rhamnose operon regulatory protein rhaS [Chlamydia abortus]
MGMFPEYHDTITVANVKKGQLPFYILEITIDFLINMHHHDYVELLYVVEGSGIEIINGKKHTLQPGTASFLLPHHIHEIQGNPASPLRVYCCMFDISVLFGSRFDFELVGRLLRSGVDLPSFVDFKNEQIEQMNSIFSSIVREYTGSNFGKFTFIRVKLLEALLQFARELQPAAQDEFRPAHDSQKRLENVIQYIHTHYAEKLTLETLSKKFNLSPPYISQGLKKLCGEGFVDYMHKIRIGSALSLLSSTDMPVADVAVEVGFDSYRSFTRVFRKLRGMTPSQYRETYINTDDIASHFTQG